MTERFAFEFRSRRRDRKTFPTLRTGSGRADNGRVFPEIDNNLCAAFCDRPNLFVRTVARIGDGQLVAEAIFDLCKAKLGLSGAGCVADVHLGPGVVQGN